MTQAVSQVSAEQAYVGQTGKKSAPDGGEFRSLIRSAAKSGDKTGSKPKSGEDAVESKDDGKMEPLEALRQNAAQAVVVPVYTDFSTLLQDIPAEKSAAETPLSVTNAAAADVGAGQTQALSADPPVSGETLPTDAAIPALNAETAQARAVPEQPKESFVSPKESSGFADASAVQRKSAVSAQASPERTAQEAHKPTVPGDFTSQAGETSLETGAEPSVSERAVLSDVKLSMEQVRQEGKAESGAAGETVRPIKKAEPSEKNTSSGSLSDLYAGGNVVIKISDAKTAQKPSAVRQIAQTVAQQVRQGKQEFQVELYPKSLGKVSVRLSSENGILTVEIAASNPKTQSLLLSGSEDIRSLLQNASGQNVTVTQPEQSGGWYHRQDGGNSGNQRQEREEEKRKGSASAQEILSIGAGGMSTDSFLSIMRGLA